MEKLKSASPKMSRHPLGFKSPYCLRRQFPTLQIHSKPGVCAVSIDYMYLISLMVVGLGRCEQIACSVCAARSLL